MFMSGPVCYIRVISCTYYCNPIPFPSHPIPIIDIGILIVTIHYKGVSNVRPVSVAVVCRRSPNRLLKVFPDPQRNVIDLLQKLLRILRTLQHARRLGRKVQK